MKKIISIILVLSMMLCFAACGAKKKTKVDDTTDTADTAAPDDSGSGETTTEKRARGNVYEGTSKEDAEKCAEYAQRFLDCLYHEKTEGIDHGDTLYENNLEAVKDLIFTNTYGDPEYVTEEEEAQYLEITKEYISKADYTVDVEENEDGTYSAVINVNAIHLLGDAKDDIMAYREEWHKRYDALTNEELNQRSEDQWKADYIESMDSIIGILKGKLEGVSGVATPLSLYIILDDETDSGLSMEIAELNNYIVGVTQ